MNSMTMVTITNIIVKPQQSGWLGKDPITKTMTSKTIAHQARQPEFLHRSRRRASFYHSGH